MNLRSAGVLREPADPGPRLRPRRRAGFSVPPPPIWTLLAFRSRVRAGAELAGPGGRMADSQAFCVAEERSGHCAVVDGHFLYVWGGYVIRKK